MRFVRGADLRWLPSRHHHAVFRLAAYLRLAAARRRGLSPPAPALLLFVARHQSAFETYSVALWMTATALAWCTWGLTAVLPPLLAAAAAIPVTALALHVPMILYGGVLVPLWHAAMGRHVEAQNNIRSNSRILMLLFAGLAVPLATVPSWVRFFAWQFLAAIAVNGVAALAAFALRGRIARLEREAGGQPSGA